MVGVKAERLLNLYIMLLVQRRYVPKESIRAQLYPEHPVGDRRKDEAFEKQFERDKDDLRALGIDVEVGSADAYFDDEPGYRIRPDRSSLPEITFEADEAAVIGVATRTWEIATLAKATTDAVRKLRAQGVEVDPDRLGVTSPRIGAAEPSFEAFWEAVQARRAVSFDYTRRNETTTRRLQPWGVVRTSGRWYVVGYDVDRAEERVFRLSRVSGPVRATGRSAAYEIPAGTDVREVARRLSEPSTAVEVTLLARSGTALGLRRLSTNLEESVAGPDELTGWDRITLTAPAAGIVQDVLAHGADVLVEAPEELRSEVVTRLDGILDHGLRRGEGA